MVLFFSLILYKVCGKNMIIHLFLLFRYDFMSNPFLGQNDVHKWMVDFIVKTHKASSHAGKKQYVDELPEEGAIML